MPEGASLVEDDPLRPPARTPRRRPAASCRCSAPCAPTASERCHPRLEHVRAEPVPGEAPAALRHERAATASRCRSTATASRCATGSTSRTTAPRSSWRCGTDAPARPTTSAAGRRRRTPRSRGSSSSTPEPTVARPAGRGPAGARPPLLARHDEDPRGARLGASGPARRRLPAHGRLVRGEPRLVGADQALRRLPRVLREAVRRPPRGVVAVPLPQVVALTVARGPVTLAGSLWLPQAAPLATVLMWPGSGPSDRDNDVFFPPIREHLLGGGLAVASFDKRGVGGSTGDWRDAGIEEQADDARAIVAPAPGTRSVGSRSGCTATARAAGWCSTPQRATAGSGLSSRAAGRE